MLVCCPLYRNADSHKVPLTQKVYFSKINLQMYFFFTYCGLSKLKVMLWNLCCFFPSNINAKAEVCLS